MTTRTYYELRCIYPSGDWMQLSEGIGEVSSEPVTYANYRTACNGYRRMKRHDELPKTGRTVIVQITVEELPLPEEAKKEEE